MFVDWKRVVKMKWLIKITSKDYNFERWINLITIAFNYKLITFLNLMYFWVIKYIQTWSIKQTYKFEENLKIQFVFENEIPHITT